MVTGLTVPPLPDNEPVRSYAPGSAERSSLLGRIAELSKQPRECPCVIAGERVTTGETFAVRAPHRLDLELATVHAATPDVVRRAIDAALEAKPAWEATPWEERAAILLKAAELLSGPWRDTLNAATMLGQSKTVFQAEIDAACELIDFWRFNAHFYARILADQPRNAPGVWNRLEYRPLEGFVLAITPFNFTSIAGNLPTAPALCGNTVVWKPSEKQALAAQYTMELLEAAGLPPGVINLVHGDGALVADICTAHPEFAGLHFTGSTAVLRSLWRTIGERIDTYRSYPRIVGESGGKDFIVAHPSADDDALITAIVRGAFEYQGQKCSAASRAYLPRSTWQRIADRLIDTTRSLPMGDVADLRNFLGAVIDRRAFDKHRAAFEQARSDPATTIVVGGEADDSIGYFVSPTIILTTDPRHDLMQRELFGPILTVFVYEDREWSEVLDLVDTTSPYGLTGAVFATDRAAIVDATERLRHAAGNFYINDKPTGAVVAQQPFGGGRASGTNDKAGSAWNLLRWLSPRAIKETFVPPTDHRYPHMLPE